MRSFDSALGMASDRRITDEGGWYLSLQSLLREPGQYGLRPTETLRQKHLLRLRNTMIRPLKAGAVAFVSPFTKATVGKAALKSASREVVGGDVTRDPGRSFERDLAPELTYFGHTVAAIERGSVRQA